MRRYEKRKRRCQAPRKGTERSELRMKLWQIGLLVFIVGGLINTVLMNAGIGGLLRELARLSVLVGLVLLAVGLIKRKK